MIKKSGAYFARNGWLVGVNLDPARCHKFERKKDGARGYYFETSDERVVAQYFLKPGEGGEFTAKSFAKACKALPDWDASFPEYAWIMKNWGEYQAWLEVMRLRGAGGKNGLV